MEWRPEYTTEILEIDEQHKKLLQLFSNIEAAIARGSDPRDVHSGIDDLRLAVAFHFSFEEALMRMFGYAEVAGHGEKHQKMLNALEGIQRNLRRSPDYEELRTFLEGWLLKHICQTDRSYAQWILSGAPAVRAN